MRAILGFISSIFMAFATGYLVGEIIIHYNVQPLELVLIGLPLTFGIIYFATEKE